VQGGFEQDRDAYTLPQPPERFNSIACGVNDPVTGLAYLGCGPSAFIGLVGEKFKNHNKSFDGKNSSNTSLLTFRQWLVAPTGPNGRPRIASYMGTVYWERITRGSRLCRDSLAEHRISLIKLVPG